MKEQTESLGVGTLRSRGVWSVLDQVMSSATNFGLLLVVLISVSLREFGAFTVSVMTYQVVLIQARALIADPLLIRYSHRPASHQLQAAASATGTTLVLTTPAALLLLAIGWMADNTLGESLMALAVTLPALMLQDTWRQVFFLTGRPAFAFVNDTVWGVGQLVAVVGLLVWGEAPVWSFVLAWGAAAALAALFGFFQARIMPAPRQWRAWLREHRDLGGRFWLEALLSGPSRELSYFLIGAIAGLAALGALQGAILFLGPARLVFVGLAPFAVAEGVRMVGVSPGRFRILLQRYGLLNVGLALTLGFIGLMLPVSFMERFIEQWGDIRPYLVPITAFGMFQGAFNAALVGLRALAAAKESLRLVTITSPLTVVLAVAGAWLGGGLGGATGLAVALAIRAAAFWRSLGLLSPENQPTEAEDSAG